MRRSQPSLLQAVCISDTQYWAGWGGGAAQPYAAYPLPVAGPIAPEQEIIALKGQAESLQSALDGIRSRIEQLQGEKDK